MELKAQLLVGHWSSTVIFSNSYRSSIGVPIWTSGRNHKTGKVTIILHEVKYRVTFVAVGASMYLFGNHFLGSGMTAIFNSPLSAVFVAFGNTF